MRNGSEKQAMSIPWAMEMKAVSAVDPSRLVQTLTGAILASGGWVLSRGANDSGMPLAVAGTVYSVNGNILQDATLEIWQTDNAGHYDNQGYLYRAIMKPDGKGGYAFESVLPGHYPARVAQHVHYLVTAPGHKPITTQLYFATDPVFQGDPDKNMKADPLITSRELIRAVVIKGDPGTHIVAAVNFDIVLEKA